MTPTLFQKLLGATFYSLPPAVRNLHGVRGHARYEGQVTIIRGHNPLARFCAGWAKLPPAMEKAPISVDFESSSVTEQWCRNFNGHRMRSRLRIGDKLLEENLGPLQFRFTLHVYDDALHWRVKRVRLCGLLSLPTRWFDEVRCREREQLGRYEFQVIAAMSFIGLLVHYEGWLRPAESSDGAVTNAPQRVVADHQD